MPFLLSLQFIPVLNKDGFIRTGREGGREGTVYTPLAHVHQGLMNQKSDVGYLRPTSFSISFDNGKQIV